MDIGPEELAGIQQQEQAAIQQMQACDALIEGIDHEWLAEGERQSAEGEALFASTPQNNPGLSPEDYNASGGLDALKAFEQKATKYMQGHRKWLEKDRPELQKLRLDIESALNGYRQGIAVAHQKYAMAKENYDRHEQIEHRGYMEQMVRLQPQQVVSAPAVSAPQFTMGGMEG